MFRKFAGKFLNFKNINNKFPVETLFVSTLLGILTVFMLGVGGSMMIVYFISSYSHLIVRAVSIFSIVIFIFFIIWIILGFIVMAASKVIAYRRYCYLPLTKEEIISINSNDNNIMINNLEDYLRYIESQLKYKNFLGFGSSYIELNIKEFYQIVNLAYQLWGDDILAKRIELKEEKNYVFPLCHCLYINSKVKPWISENENERIFLLGKENLIALTSTRLRFCHMSDHIMGEEDIKLVVEHLLCK